MNQPHSFRQGAESEYSRSSMGSEVGITLGRPVMASGSSTGGYGAPTSQPYQHPSQPYGPPPTIQQYAAPPPPQPAYNGENRNPPRSNSQQVDGAVLFAGYHGEIANGFKEDVRYNPVRRVRHTQASLTKMLMHGVEEYATASELAVAQCQ